MTVQTRPLGCSFSFDSGIADQFGVNAAIVFNEIGIRKFLYREDMDWIFSFFSSFEINSAITILSENCLITENPENCYCLKKSV
jgi:hypothetical protein